MTRSPRPTDPCGAALRPILTPSAVQRLQTRAQFQAVMNAGTLAKTPHFVLHAAVPARTYANDPAAPKVPALTGTGPWLGALVPKRWARHAVTRNLIRRQVYAVGARHAAAWEAAACVVRLRSGFDRRVFTSARSDALRDAVRGELETLYAQAGRALAAVKRSVA
ncbi:MAG: hypothetical protein Fur0019_12190 [Tibeticola sp.]